MAKVESRAEMSAARPSTPQRLPSSTNPSLDTSSKVWQWRIEFLSVATTGACLAAMVVLVFTNDKKPLSDWTLPVTLNAMISILSVALNACLLAAVQESTGQWKWVLFHEKPRSLLDFERIDLASRGAVGCAGLLFRSWSEGVILRFGAIVTILALALGPFTQQVVQTRDEVSYTQRGLWDRNGIGATKRYDDRGWIQTQNVNSSTAILGLEMQAAILVGLDGLSINRPIYSCPTPDCTWPTYRSLAVCSECNLVPSSNISQVPGNVIDLFRTYIGAIDVEKNATAFQLNNGQFIVNADGFYVNGNGDDVYGPEMTSAFTMSAAQTAVINQTLTLQHLDNLIWAVSVLQWNVNATTNWPDKSFQTEECGLYWCVNEYESRLDGGNFSETSRTISVQHVDDEYYGFMLCPSDGNDCFGPFETATEGLYNFFNTTYSANLTARNASAPSKYDQLQNQAIMVGQSYEPAGFRQIWNTDKPSLNQTFGMVADSMTTQVRAFGLQNFWSQNWNNSYYAGFWPIGNYPQIGQTETVFHMEWAWMILHGIEVLGGAIYLGLTVFVSGKKRMPRLKNSALAVLQRASAVADVWQGAESLEQLKYKARTNVVVFGERNEHETD